jgi:hypothetical protein
MGLRRKAAVLVVGLGSLASRVAWADPSPLDANVVYDYGESQTPRGAGMGGALRALGTGTNAIFQNPAGLAAAPVYHIEALSQVTPETRRWLLGAAISDSVTTRLAGAFSIVGTPIVMDPNGLRRTYIDVRLGLAFPITDRFIIGLSGRYVDVTQSGGAAPSYGFCNSLVSGGLVDPSSGIAPARSNSACANPGGGQDRLALVNTVTFDAGVVIKPTDTLSIAFVGQNLSYYNTAFLPFMFGGGIGFGFDYFAVEVDGIADMSSWGVPGAERPKARVGAGAEYRVGGVVPLRLGYKYDQGATLNTLSFGSGYIGNEFAVEATVSRTASNPGATTAFLSVAYYLEATGVTRAASVEGGP